ncbi:UNVERIFIED_CONTAM: hypothetical protein GTU68_052238, partial [Idotea baltica]|nr:hypothetical protein [Idotea baltica]
ESERYYFLEERYPEYGNLVPRDIATREIFDVCVNDGLSVESDKQCVYLDLTHIPREELDRKLGGILNIYEKFQGDNPRDVPMKIFPAVHYSMGGLWADYTPGTELPASSPNSPWRLPHHGGNRLGANSLLSCIFTGLFAAPGIKKMIGSLDASTTDECFDSLHQHAQAAKQADHDALLKQAGEDGENPYELHHLLGEEMTKAATVVRRNDQIEAALGVVYDLAERAQRCSLSDTDAWSNQNVVFTKALRDMFPLAKALLKGALARDECRGAHFKPDFALKKNDKWLKTSVATFDKGEPTISYEEVDTSLIPPRPRLYGMVGAEEIAEVWKERQAAKDAAAAGQPALAGS